MVQPANVPEPVPWNVGFGQELKGRAFAPREGLALAQEQFSAAFGSSLTKRAKLRGLERNAAVVLGSIGTSDDVAVLTRALDDPEPPVRKHAAWALERVN